jgi:adenosine deaminase
MAATRVMTSPGDYARLVREYCEEARRAGVRYAELEISPAWPWTRDRFAEAADAAAKERDITLRFVLGLGRVLPVDLCLEALDLIKGLPGFVALGLGGPEEGFPPEPYAAVFAEARQRGIRSAPHAGESAGPASITGALDALAAERIQHGVRAIEDAVLIERLADERTPLAVCPISNLRLGVVESIDAHPLRELWDAGVSVSVNTDDPGFFDSDLVGEYAIAGRLLGLDRQGYARLARNSVDGSFAPDALKDELRHEIDAWAEKRR